jgi:hypothetical protein
MPRGCEAMNHLNSSSDAKPIVCDIGTSVALNACIKPTLIKDGGTPRLILRKKGGHQRGSDYLQQEQRRIEITQFV